MSNRLVLAENYMDKVPMLSEAYIPINIPNNDIMYVRKDAFLSELKNYDEETQYQLMEELWPGYLGLDPATIGVIITATGKVVNFVKGIFGGKDQSDPSVTLPASTVILGMGANGMVAMINKGNAVYYKGKMFLTEQGYKLMDSQTWPSATVKTQYMGSFPFTVPEAWKPTLASLEQKDQVEPLPGGTPQTSPTFSPFKPPVTTLPTTQPSGTDGRGAFINVGYTDDQRSWYQKPWGIAGIVGGSALVLYLAYRATRPKKQTATN